jgi:4-hydroxybenzoate polyprenyltransferase
MGQLADLARLLRLKQWIKNGFVLAPLVFARQAGEPAALAAAALACLAFCLAASGVYALNDLIDREQDKLHPVKCRRPLASGRIGPAGGLILALVCFAGALPLATLLGKTVLAVITGYIVLNILYSLVLKNQVILDVLILASGFLLRIAAGAAAIAVPLSHWLLLTTLALALFLGFAKRRGELAQLGEDAARHRPSLSHYSARLLDLYLACSLTLTIVCYALYTIDSRVSARIGNESLVYTTPLVLYALFRYLYLVQTGKQGGDPTELILRDRPILITIFIWLAATAALFYFGKTA